MTITRIKNRKLKILNKKLIAELEEEKKIALITDKIRTESLNDYKSKMSKKDWIKLCKFVRAHGAKHDKPLQSRLNIERDIEELKDPAKKAKRLQDESLEFYY